jgi:hypothetical protein
MRPNTKKIIKALREIDDRGIEISESIKDGYTHSLSISIDSIKNSELSIFTYNRDSGKDNVRFWVSSVYQTAEDIVLIRYMFKEHFGIDIYVYPDKSTNQVYAHIDLYGKKEWVAFNFDNWVGLEGEFDRKKIMFLSMQRIKYDDIPQIVRSSIESNPPVGVAITKTQW